MKRGFLTKEEALEWKREFLQQKNADLDMTFELFIKIYIDDMQSRIKRNTWQTKLSIIEKKILPYFQNKKMSEITPKYIIKWQNEMINYRDSKE